MRESNYNRVFFYRNNDTFIYMYLHTLIVVVRDAYYSEARLAVCEKFAVIRGTKVSETCLIKFGVNLYILRNEKLFITSLANRDTVLLRSRNLLRRKRHYSLRPGRSGTNLFRAPSFVVYQSNEKFPPTMRMSTTTMNRRRRWITSLRYGSA